MSTLIAPALYPPGFAQVALRSARRIAVGAAAIVRSLIHRRGVHRLLELSDRELNDIGLVRGQVLGALAEPFGIDPSTRLALGDSDPRYRGARRRT